MRKGRVAGEPKSGGAWECSAIIRAEDSGLWDSLNARTTPSATGENEMPCTDDGWPRATCMAGMVLQQS